MVRYRQSVLFPLDYGGVDIQAKGCVKLQEPHTAKFLAG